MNHKTVRNILRRLDLVLDHAVDIAAVLGGVVVVLQTAAVAGNTFLSFFFDKWITGVESMTEFGILYITFLGAAWIQKHDRHVKVDLVTNALSAKTQAVLVFINSVACVGVCLIFTVFGAYVTWDRWVRRVTDYFKLEDFPIAVAIAVIPVGSFLLTYQFVKKAAEAWQEISKSGTEFGSVELEP